LHCTHPAKNAENGSDPNGEDKTMLLQFLSVTLSFHFEIEIGIVEDMEHG